VGDILTLKAFVVCKTEPLSCFSCKIDILWVVPFLQNRSNVVPSPLPKRGQQDVRSSASSFILQYLWCDFDRASLLICGNKIPTGCNRGFYCRSYCLLNMFRAPLCPSSGAQEYYTVVAAIRSAIKPLLHLVGILFPHMPVSSRLRKVIQ